MVHAPTIGLHNDAEVLTQALSCAIPGIEVHSLDIPWNPNLDFTTPTDVPDEIASVAPFDVTFLLEHLYGHPPLRSRHFALRRVFVPNAEWLMPQDEAELQLHPPDVILYKNEFSRERCRAIPGFAAVADQVTGWTSHDFPAPANSAFTKDFRTFLHVRGVSAQKHASVVLETWLQNPDFPTLTLICAAHDEFSVPVPLKAAHNVQIIMRNLPLEELRVHQHANGVHVYPSYAEGFGHALNETRICSSVLVTTCAPPMEDLVRPGETGFLVSVDAADTGPFRRGTRFPVRAAALADTIREVLATPVERLRAIGCRAREGYRLDQQRFYSAVRRLCHQVGLSNG